MPTYYKGELCVDTEEAIRLGKIEIMKESEILRTNLRNAKISQEMYA